MDDPELVAFVADAYPPLAAALARTAGDADLGCRAAEEALITALTRWKQVARTPSPIGWCYLRGLEELRTVGTDPLEPDRRILDAGDVEAAARRIQDLQDPTAPPPPPADAPGLVRSARKRRTLQAVIGMTVALTGVTVVALLLAWLQSPTF